jgi:hypothetical protein
MKCCPEPNGLVVPIARRKVQGSTVSSRSKARPVSSDIPPQKPKLHTPYEMAKLLAPKTGFASCNHIW